MNNIQRYRTAARDEDFFTLKGLFKELNRDLNLLKGLIEKANANNNYFYQQLKTIREQDKLKVLKSCIVEKPISFLDPEFSYATLSKAVSVHHLINMKSHMVRDFKIYQHKRKKRINKMIRRGMFEHIQHRKGDFKYEDKEEYLFDHNKLKFIFSPFN